MKSVFAALSCLVVAAFCLGGCRHPLDAIGTYGATIPAGDADVGKTFGLFTGETFEVRLTSNATTGYGWQQAETKGDSLVPLDRQGEYVPDKVSAGVVGSGGQNIFRFRATKPGKETLSFVYARPFAPGEVAKRARFEVVVQ